MTNRILIKNILRWFVTHPRVLCSTSHIYIKNHHGFWVLMKNYRLWLDIKLGNITCDIMHITYNCGARITILNKPCTPCVPHTS